MVIYTSAALALYCSHCGKIHTHNICRFSLNACNQTELRCSCGHMQAKISPARKDQFFLTIYCELCRKNHVLCVNFTHSGASELRKLYCANNNLELGFVGKRQLIEQTLERHRYAVNRALPDQSGTDNENSQVLLDVLNRVHDIAESGGVRCNCGSAAIRAEVLASCIELRCQTCGASVALAARNDMDLARLDEVKNIELSLSCHSRQTY
ncbi:hypothetical protein AXX12_01485 [Anaerosporomusa subterranea]|uniref:Uncharacterized protein n=1 Tax=Anaerosporomusa subterranea TaxID=1794912 RepID=A0A154BW38_ANASB|nr:hypothetical protein [Anaerosporomusa subterranea]KYZ78243.1 hypothetical protein AXX12_01485 [Anaerosporomusa subterranea]